MSIRARGVASRVLFGMVVAGLSPLARGDEFLVDAAGGGDFVRVQDAIDAAAEGDVVRIRPGFYAERLSLGTKSITLEGDGLPSEVVLSSPDGETMLRIDGGQGSGLRFRGITWTGGATRRLVVVNAGGPVFERCVFRNNLRGAMDVIQLCASTAGPLFDRCLFLDNEEPNGGAIYLLHTNCQFVDCDFVGNRAVGPTSGVNAGGAVYVNDWTCGTHTYAFTRCSFAWNSAVWGGAIYSQGIFRNATTQMPVVDCEFRGNAASQGRSMWNWYITAPISGSWFCGGGDQIRNFWTNAGGNDFNGDCASPPSADCDGDGIRDGLATLLGIDGDCDADGVPDSCEILAGTASDANGDGVPDACDGVLEVPDEYATIQEAVDAAVDGDIVLVAAGVHAPFDFRSKRIEVRSASGAEVTTIDAAGLPTSAVTIGSQATFATVLRGFTILTGSGTVFPQSGSSWRAGGGCYLWGDPDDDFIPSATIEDCVFIGSSGGCGYGAGVWTRAANLAIRRCVFDGTNAQHHGPAISIEAMDGETVPGTSGRHVVVEDCLIRNTSSYNNGGILVGIGPVQSPASVLIERCEFDSNHAAYQAGALLVGSDRAGAGGAVDVHRCVFRNNQASSANSIGIALLGGTPDFETAIAGCVIADPAVAVRLGTGSMSLGDNFICAGAAAVQGSWSDAGGNRFSCPPSDDCDGDGRDDLQQIVLGLGADADGDGTLDGCVPVIRVPTDFATIQAAIDAVASGSSGRIAVAAGVYNEAFSLNGKNVVVRGAPDDATILDGAGLSTSLVRFTGGEPATAGVEDLVFRNGVMGGAPQPNADFRGGGALLATGSAAFVRGCRFEDCRADIGAAACFIDCEVLVEDCEFFGNGATINGGAIALRGSSGAIVDCMLADNRSGLAGLGSGSAAIVEQVPAGEALILEGVSMLGNAGLLSAAAFEYSATGDAGVVRIEDSVIEGNEASASDLLTGVEAGGVRSYAPASRLVLAGTTRVCSNAPWNIDGPFLLEGAAEVCDLLSDLVPDGVIDGSDLAILLGAWGGDAEDGRGDVDHDGDVDGADLALLLGSWGLVAGQN